MLHAWNASFSEDMLSFYGRPATVHAADAQGRPDPEPDGEPITVIEQPNRQGAVNNFQSIYRESWQYVTNNPGAAAQGKFLRLEGSSEYWYITAVSPLGWGWHAIGANKGDS